MSVYKEVMAQVAKEVREILPIPITKKFSKRLVRFVVRRYFSLFWERREDANLNR